MARSNSQSPRANRSSTQNPLERQKGSVENNVDPSEAGVGDDVPNPWRHQDEQDSPLYEADGHSPRER